MMSEISYHQQQYIRHQKREKKLVLFLRIFILLFFLVLWEISARTGLIDSFIFSSPVMIWHSFCSMCRDGSIFPHLSVTITETLVSFLFVVVLGAGMAERILKNYLNGKYGALPHMDLEIAFKHILEREANNLESSKEQ